VAWKDVTAITTCTIHSQSFLLFMLNNPQEYIDYEGNLFRRFLKKQNFNMVGTPISITFSCFRIAPKELERIMTEQYENYRERELQQ
jgi:hypothetical protein